MELESNGASGTFLPTKLPESGTSDGRGAPSELSAAASSPPAQEPVTPSRSATVKVPTLRNTPLRITSVRNALSRNASFRGTSLSSVAPALNGTPMLLTSTSFYGTRRHSMVHDNELVTMKMLKEEVEESHNKEARGVGFLQGVMGNHRAYIESHINEFANLPVFGNKSLSSAGPGMPESQRPRHAEIMSSKEHDKVSQAPIPKARETNTRKRQQKISSLWKGQKDTESGTLAMNFTFGTSSGKAKKKMRKRLTNEAADPYASIREAGSDFVAMVVERNSVEQHLVPLEWAKKHLSFAKDSEEKELVLPVDDVLMLLRGVGQAAKPLFRLAKIGIIVRMSISLLATYLDVGTDAFIVRDFILGEHYDFAYLSVGFIGLSLLLQVVLVFILQQPYIELFYIFAFLKPAVDTFRVVFNLRKPEKQSVATSIVLFCTKGSEVVCEAYPEVILQLIFLFSSSATNGVSGLQAASLATSVLCIGYNMASSSIDIDTAVDDRKDNPSFFGYCPKSGAGEFACLVLMSMAMSFFIISKSITICCVAISAGGAAVFAWYILETIFFYVVVQGIGRGNWLYYTAQQKSMVDDVTMSIFVNCFVYHWTTIGLCPVPHFRQGIHVGGACWSGGVLYSLISNVVISTIVASSVEPSSPESQWYKKVNPWSPVAAVAISSFLSIITGVLCYSVVMASGLATSSFLSRTSPSDYVKKYWEEEDPDKCFWDGIKVQPNIRRAIHVALYRRGLLPVSSVRAWILANAKRWNHKPPNFWADKEWRRVAAFKAGLTLTPDEAKASDIDELVGFAERTIRT